MEFSNGIALRAYIHSVQDYKHPVMSNERHLAWLGLESPGQGGLRPLLSLQVKSWFRPIKSTGKAELIARDHNSQKMKPLKPVKERECDRIEEKTLLEGKYSISTLFQRNPIIKARENKTEMYPFQILPHPHLRNYHL